MLSPLQPVAQLGSRGRWAHTQIVVLAEVEIPSILFTIAFVTGAIWMIGEHALFWLGMETNVLTDHRDKLGVAYLLSVTALLIVASVRDEPDSK